MAGKFLEELEGWPEPDESGSEDEPLVPEDVRDPAWTAAFELVRQPFGALLARVTAPTLILWGADDGIAPVRTGRALAFRLPAAEQVVLADAGHMVMLDAPERFVRHLREFIERPAAGLPHAHPRALPGHPPTSDRVGRCQGERNVRFTGEYARIELTNCDGVVIEKAWIGQLLARESRAHVIDSAIIGVSAAVEATGSDLEFTATVIEGAIAFRLAGSRLDLVGCELTATTALAKAERASNVVFSITRARAPDAPAELHEFREVAPERRP
jgi:hypothetical protein